MWLPQRASRLIIATGSVWDAFDTYHKAASGLRGVSLPNAAGALLQRALRHKQHRADKGDLSVLVVDLVPHSCSGFSSQVSEVSGRARWRLHPHNNPHTTCLVQLAAAQLRRVLQNHAFAG